MIELDAPPTLSIRSSCGRRRFDLRPQHLFERRAQLRAGFFSGAEVHRSGCAADALHPDVLDARDSVIDVVRRDEHVGVERLVGSVAGSVEVGVQHDGVVAGAHGLEGLVRHALEVRARQESVAVPADALSRLTSGEPPRLPTGEVQLKLPPEWAGWLEELKAPPPVRVTAPDLR